MRIRIELADPDEPYAVRSVDFARDASSLLIGRHSQDASPRLGVLRLSPVEWIDSFDGALDAAATRARYCDADREIVFVDERSRAYAIENDRNDHKPPVHLAIGVRHISVAHEAALVGVGGKAPQIWDLASGRSGWCAKAVDLPADSSIALNRDGTLAALARSSSPELKIIDTGVGTVLRSLYSRLEGIDQIEIDHRGKWIAAIGDGFRGCIVFDLVTGATAGEIFCNPGQNNNTAQALNPRYDLLAYGTIVGYVVLVDLERNEIVYMEKLHRTRIWDLVFSADGHLLATAGDDGSVMVVDLAEMRATAMSTMPA